VIEPRDTRTSSIEVDVEADAAFAVLADARHIPLWAPGFADVVEPTSGDQFDATKDGRRFSLRIVTRADSRTIDFLREIHPSRDSGASIRVLPGPQRGCVVVVTLPIPPGVDGGAVQDTLAAELAAIASLVTDPPR
jgi:hypothetical protein